MQRRSEERPGFRQSLVALQHRDYRLLFFTSMVSGLGGALVGAANLWQIFELTGSPLQVGLTGLARAIPIILFSLAGGVVADRFERRKILMATQVTGGMFALTLGVLSGTGLIQVWHIYVLTFVSASVQAASGPAREAIVPNLVPRHHLMNAVALNSSIYQMSRIVGPSMAGLLISTIGIPFTYAVNGVANVFAFLLLGRIYLGPIPGRPRSGAWRSLVEGLAFVRKRSIILVLLAADTSATVFASYQGLLPIIAGQHDAGATGFGLISSASGIGALVGSIFVAGLGDVRYKGFMIIGAILAYCAGVAGLALAPWFWLAVALSTFLGFVDALQATPRNALIQLITPDELRGRVSSFRSMLAQGMPSLGQATMGGAAAALTVPVALLLGSAICAVFNVALLATRRDLRARDLGAEPAAPIAAKQVIEGANSG